VADPTPTSRHPYPAAQLGPTRVPGLARHLGFQLRAARVSAGLSPMRLAARLGQGYTSVMALERGQHSISTDQLVRYCAAVDADPTLVLSDALAFLAHERRTDRERNRTE